MNLIIVQGGIIFIMNILNNLFATCRICTGDYYFNSTLLVINMEYFFEETGRGQNIVPHTFLQDGFLTKFKGVGIESSQNC